MKKHLPTTLLPRAPQSLKGAARRTPFRAGVSAALILFIFSALHSFSQNPLVKQWDARFGGTGDDYLTCFQQTKDGGYIIGGWSLSGIGGDKTQANRDTVCTFGCTADYWIVKTDSLGNKEWDKDFGGTGYDVLYSLQQTADGGYILGGWSQSGIGGDKTQATWGGDDYWIIKIDSFGNKQWDKDFGGTNDDKFYSLQQTADGGYILGGYSGSGIGGDKTQANWDASGNTVDYWIIKIDSYGNKQWDKDFGGTNDDWFFSLQQTADGGYILGGWSNSGIGGVKTHANWDASGNTVDYWIVKIDSLGNKERDRDLGGTNDDWFFSLQQTADRGYILGGRSFSGIGGDKTQATWGVPDYWIVKTDSLGNKEWDKDLGGTSDEDEFGNVSQTKDGGYLIAGNSYSNISGDKTENNLGVEQTWIVKTDSLGTKQWDKTILSPGRDEKGYAIQTREGCYAVASADDGGIGGYKTQTAWSNTYDYWLVKFCDSTLATNTAGSISENKNELVVYPNPVQDKLEVRSLESGAAAVDISIYNLLGEKVLAVSPLSLGRGVGGEAIDCRLLPSGIYYLEVISGEKIFRSKFIKQ